MNTSNEPKLNVSQIIINEDFERRYWMSKFNCTNEELKHALKTVGAFEDKVAEFISSQRQNLNHAN